MIIVNADDRAYLLEKIPMVPLDSGTVRSVLLSIDDWLMTDGFAPPDYYDYSDEGRISKYYVKSAPSHLVRLLSCETGKGEECFAQLLADELQVEVSAPNDILWARIDHSFTIGAS